MANKITGTVASIGESGNLITSISHDQVAEAPRNESVSIKFSDHETYGLFAAEHEEPDATMVACLGSSGFVEIEIVGIPLAEMLGIRVGEKVVIKW